MSSFTNTADSSNTSEFTDNLNILRQIDFFSGLPMEVTKLFAFLCKRQSYKTGNVIFQQGDDDQCAYYLLSGKARLLLEKDGEEHLIRLYEKEYFFGVLSLMSPMAKSLSLVATEETACLVITRQAFSKVVDQFPDIPLSIARTIAQRALKFERRAILEFENKTAEEFKQFLGISLI